MSTSEGSKISRFIQEIETREGIIWYSSALILITQKDSSSKNGFNLRRKPDERTSHTLKLFDLHKNRTNIELLNFADKILELDLYVGIIELILSKPGLDILGHKISVRTTNDETDSYLRFKDNKLTIIKHTPYLLGNPYGFTRPNTVEESFKYDIITDLPF